MSATLQSCLRVTTSCVNCRNGSIVRALHAEPAVTGIILRYDVNFTSSPGEHIFFCISPSVHLTLFTESASSYFSPEKQCPNDGYGGMYVSCVFSPSKCYSSLIYRTKQLCAGWLESQCMFSSCSRMSVAKITNPCVCTTRVQTPSSHHLCLDN